MISNPNQRDGTDGTAASASAEDYLKRRQGNLLRSSDGFRSPTLARDPRRPTEGGHRPDRPMTPYGGTPRVDGDNDKRNTPRTWAYFRQPSPGAPRVPFPDAERTRGRLQQSGAAWGSFNATPRAVLTPATNGKNAPPSHRLGSYTPGNPSASGPRWKRPASPILRDHMPH